MNRFHLWYCGSGRWRRRLNEEVLPWSLEGVELGEQALELGPGPGLTTDALRGRVKRLTCLEIDPQLAEALRARMPREEVTVVEGDATAMPFPDASFDSAVSLTMLHHVPSVELQDQLFAEVRRVLRPGGTFAGSDSIPNFVWNVAHLFDTRVPLHPSTLGERLGTAGFVDVRVEVGRREVRFRARRPMAEAG